MDSLTPERRSWNMGRIRGRDTKPELLLRSVLHREGLRFRLHAKTLPGRPDLVLPKYRIAIFVHGCFWHRHQACPFAYNPKSNAKFWQKKFGENVARDARKADELRRAGWRVMVVWECEVKRISEDPSNLIRKIRSVPRSRRRAVTQ